jgi:hypothetical protein
MPKGSLLFAVLWAMREPMIIPDTTDIKPIRTEIPASRPNKITTKTVKTNDAFICQLIKAGVMILLAFCLRQKTRNFLWIYPFRQG